MQRQKRKERGEKDLHVGVRHDDYRNADPLSFPANQAFVARKRRKGERKGKKEGSRNSTICTTKNVANFSCFVCVSESTKGGKEKEGQREGEHVTIWFRTIISTTSPARMGVRREGKKRGEATLGGQRYFPIRSPTY